MGVCVCVCVCVCSCVCVCVFYLSPFIWHALQRCPAYLLLYLRTVKSWKHTCFSLQKLTRVPKPAACNPNDPKEKRADDSEEDVHSVASDSS